MKKAILSLILIALTITCASAESEVRALDEQLFMQAKEALTLFEAQDYTSAAELLDFGDAQELERFVAGNYTTFGSGVQTTVSVAWWNGSAWMLAVPLYEPSQPEVETLVLITNINDGSGFGGYQYSIWGDVEASLAHCDYVIWNEEYVPASKVIIYQDN